MWCIMGMIARFQWLALFQLYKIWGGHRLYHESSESLSYYMACKLWYIDDAAYIQRLFGVETDMLAGVIKYLGYHIKPICDHTTAICDHTTGCPLGTFILHPTLIKLLTELWHNTYGLVRHHTNIIWLTWVHHFA